MSTKLPSFLNYNRSIAPSEAIMIGLTPNGDRIPVEVVERTVRGTISNYSAVYKDTGAKTDENAIKKDLDPENANIQRVDAAFLPEGADRLSIEFSLIFQGQSTTPSGCNEIEARQVLTDLAGRYAELGGYGHIAGRYLWNVVNARGMWRNRMAKDIVTSIEMNGQKFSFNSDKIDTLAFDPAVKSLPGFETISSAITHALSTRDESLFLEVSMVGYLPSRAEVFPSQEFVDDSKKGKSGKGSKSKTLSSMPISLDGKTIKQATIHSQKIGNAIRTIDEWHGESIYGAIAVEPFGFAQNHSKLFRGLDKDGAKDLYDLMGKARNLIADLEKAQTVGDISDDIHYVMACLVRGGVFSGPKKSKK